MIAEIARLQAALDDGAKVETSALRLHHYVNPTPFHRCKLTTRFWLSWSPKNAALQSCNKHWKGNSAKSIASGRSSIVMCLSARSHRTPVMPLLLQVIEHLSRKYLFSSESLQSSNLVSKVKVRFLQGALSKNCKRRAWLPRNASSCWNQKIIH